MRLFLIALSVFVALPAQAFAGFEWVAPKNNPTSEAPAPMMPAPVPEATPLPAEVEAPQEIITQPEPVLQPPPPAPYNPPQAANLPISAPAPILPPVQPQKSFVPDSVQGFGTDLPLVMALSEIVPASYAYAFAPAVNPGVRVSWDGQGRPWNLVVSSMLSPLGLYAVLQGQRIFITNTPPASGFNGGAVSVSVPPVVPTAAIQTPAMPEKIIIPPRPQDEIFVDDGIVDADSQPSQLLPMP